MSNYSNYTTDRINAAPFASYVAPMNVAGEAVYEAGSLFTRAVARIAAYAMTRVKERRTLAALADLDDRSLADIGISRSEIHAVARHTARYPDIDYRSSVK
jgi:uncharacterized protein YjiS (DUF1127 family)